MISKAVKVSRTTKSWYPTGYSSQMMIVSQL